MELLLGIDIGNLYTKAVLLEPGRRLTVKQAFYFLTPYLDSLSVTKEIDKKGFVKELVNRISPARIKACRVAVNIPFYSPTTMSVILPKMSLKELGNAAIVEAKRKMIPPPGPNSVFQNLFHGEKLEGSVSRYEVLVVKAEKEPINALTAVFTGFDAGLTLITPLCAIFHAAPLRDFFPADKDTAVIDLGHASMNVSILKGGKLLFNRIIFFGCKDLIEKVAHESSLDTEQASEVLRKQGIPSVELDLSDKVKVAEEIMRRKYEDGAREGGSIDPLELRMLCEPFLERLTQEIRRTFLFYRDISGGRRVDSVYLMGGGMQYVNLLDNLKEKVGPQPELFNPFKEISVENDSIADNHAFYSNAFCLACSILSKNDQKINFLPDELKRKQKVETRQILSLWLGLIVSGLLLFVNFSLFITIGALNRSVSKLEGEIEQIEKQHRKEVSIRSNIARIDQMLEKIEVFRKSRIDFGDVVSEIIKAKPESIVFLSFSLEPFSQPGGEQVSSGNQLIALDSLSTVIPRSYVLKISAAANADYEQAYSSLQDFLAALKEVKGISDIQASRLIQGAIAPRRQGPSVELTEITWRDFTIAARIDL